MDEDIEAPVSEETDTPYQTEASVEDTPEVESTDWEKRYKDLQSTYTKTSQELKEAEQAQQFFQALSSPDTRDEAFNQLAGQLGYEVGDDEQDEYQDPLDEVRTQVEDLRSERQQEMYDREIQGLEDKGNTHLNSLAKEAGLDLDQFQKDYNVPLRDIIWNELSPTDDLDKDLDTAFGLVVGQLQDAFIKNYRGSKTSSAPPPSGSSGTEAPSLDTDKARRAFALQQANQAFADSES